MIRTPRVRIFFAKASKLVYPRTQPISTANGQCLAAHSQNAIPPANDDQLAMTLWSALRLGCETSQLGRRGQDRSLAKWPSLLPPLVLD